MTRHIAYSTASMNALAEGDSIDEALSRASGASPDRDFLVVVTIETDTPLYDLDSIPAGCPVVWRGQNELAQRYRRSAA